MFNGVALSLLTGILLVPSSAMSSLSASQQDSKILTEKEKELLNYSDKCKAFSTQLFEDLENREFIKIDRNNMINGKIIFKLLSLTRKSFYIFAITNFTTMFEELKSVYPKEVGDKLTKRRLHADMKRCKSLYEKILSLDISLHDKIIKATKAYHYEKKKSNSEIYMQNLASWLHQGNYEQYFDVEIDDIKEVTHSEDI